MSQQFYNSNNLIWLDMEMTGLSVINNVIIELAVVITDSNLNILDQSPSYVINQPESELIKMDKWNLSVHNKSGLIDKVRNSSICLQQVENEVILLISQYCKHGESPLCGNTIHQDRKFLVKYMPQLESFFSYRNIDVSSIKELTKRWYPDIYSQFKKNNKHEALEDIKESINELLFYRKNIFITI